MRKNSHLRLAFGLTLLLFPIAVWAQTPEDLAPQAFGDAVRLQGEGSASALRQAVKKYEEAIKLWKVQGKELEQARALNNIAAI